MPDTIKTTEVRIGDRLGARSGVEMTVTRIDQKFLGSDEMVVFVEDSEQQWFKLPAPRDGEVELISREGE